MATEGKSQEIAIGDGSLHVGDRVVYPNQGICRITGVSVKEIAGSKWEMVTLAREEDGATVMVPKAKVAGVGLRKVASVADIEKVFDYFAEPNDNPQLDWKVRHRENAERLQGGGLFDSVEVLRGLHALSRVRPLPQKERELYDSSRHLMVGEIAAALGIPPATAEDHLDYALWPPPGMTRKGKKLEPATIGMALKPRGVAADDELGFDDEEEEAGEKGEKGEKEEKEEKEAPAEEAGEGEDEGAAKKPKPAKAPKAARPAPAAGPSDEAADSLARAVANKLKDAAALAAKQMLVAAANAVKPAVKPAAPPAAHAPKEPPHAPKEAPHAPKEPAHAPKEAPHVAKEPAHAPKPPPAPAHPKPAPRPEPEAKKAPPKPEKKPAPKHAAKEKPAAKKAAPKAKPEKKPAAKKAASKPAAKKGKR